MIKKKRRKKKKSVQLRKGRPQRGREREKAQTLSGLERDKRHLGNCVYVRLCVCARSTVSLGTGTTSTVLMLNQSRVVNTLPFPERDTEVLQNSSCVATLVEHGVFILLYPPPRKKWRACACGWGDWGSRVWSMGDWFYVCVRAHVCVLESWLSARPPTFCSVTPLCSLALCTLEKVFISPAPKHSRVFTVKGEKASVLHTCFSVCSYILQAGPVWEGCELLLKHKAVHSYLLYLVVAYKKNISELVWIHFAANKWSPLFLGRGTND